MNLASHKVIDQSDACLQSCGVSPGLVNPGVARVSKTPKHHDLPPGLPSHLGLTNPSFQKLCISGMVTEVKAVALNLFSAEYELQHWHHGRGRGA